MSKIGVRLAGDLFRKNEGSTYLTYFILIAGQYPPYSKKAEYSQHVDKIPHPDSQLLT